VLLKVGQKEQDNSRLGRLLGTGRKLKAEKQAANAEARSLLQDMKAASREIVAQVDDLQAVLLAMSDVEFDALMAAQGLRNTPPKLSLVTQKVA
jgi:hypothetical protein